MRLRRAGNDQVGKDNFEAIISFNNVSAEQEKYIVDFVLEAQRQFEKNLGLKSAE